MPKRPLLENWWPVALALFLALPGLVSGLLLGFGNLPFWPVVCGWALCTLVVAALGVLLGQAIMAMRRLGDGLRAQLDAERLAHARLGANAAEDRALVERLPDPLMKLDAAGNLNWRNPSAMSAFGAETAALLRHPALREALAQAGRSGEPVRHSLAMAAPVQRELDATVIPVGGPVYLLLTDRTLERSLDKMRADFVANASHELRTPLASLIGFIETLRGPAADDAEAQQRFLGIMAGQAARMHRLLDDLLSLSKIEISEHQPPVELLSLGPVLERIVAGLEPMLQAGQARIEVKIATDLPMIPADADQLTQVFTNLLDNAIKYGKRGGCIKLNAARGGTDARFETGGVVVSVADDGAGIARAHIPRLTERFYRIDKGRSRAVGGTGLGLSIVKHVVNRHRGRLAIESVEGHGTIFTVWLPVRL